MSSQQSSFKTESSCQKIDGTCGNNSGMRECHEKHQTFESSGNKVECHSMESHDIGISAEEMERRAQKLREEAKAALAANEHEFIQATQAQNAARIAADVANMKTAKALENQERGQQLLAEAGAQLIEAGARLQQEAAAEKRQVPYNIHQQGEVRQTTCVSAAGQEAAAHAHEAVTLREVEHIPPPAAQIHSNV